MGLVLGFIEMELFTDNNVKFKMIGDLKRLPDSVQDKIHYMEDLTKGNDGMTLVVAMSYSSRWEITNAVRQIVTEVNDMELPLPQNKLKKLVTGGIRAEDITEEFISQHLCTNFMPDPELLIRTGGELRISNYLLWQCAYSEFYFCDTYWPDFDEEALHKAIIDYQGRQRRFGKTEAQVEEEENK
jgi:undecaprenyl diphosphate synthase